MSNQRNIKNKTQSSKGERKLKPREYGFDYTLFTAIFLLVIFGLIMLYSISYNAGISTYGSDTEYLRKQGIHAIIGLAGMWIASKVYYVARLKTKELSIAMYGISFFLVCLVPFIGVSAGGAKRWLRFGPVQFQPSEFVKVGIILFIPWLLIWLSEQRRYKVIEKFFITLLAIAAPALAVYRFTDNLSTGIIIGGIGVLIWLVVCKHGTRIMCWGLAGILLFVGGLRVWADHFLTMDASFRWRRILTWVDPEQYAIGDGFQVLQSLYAIGAGGLFGKGLGNGLQKVSSIPEVQNDMIFAAICEELGLFGVGIIFLLFGIILYRLVKIAANAPSLYDSLVVSGIFAHIAIQVIFNILVVTAIFPNTGITLPFISYGGTALVIVMCELGLALGVSRK